MEPDLTTAALLDPLEHIVERWPFGEALQLRGQVLLE
jgi:hypothetical protein